MHVLNVHARPGQDIFEEKKNGVGTCLCWGLLLRAVQPEGLCHSFTASKLTSLISSHTLHTSLPYEADEEKKRKDARIVVYTLSANNCIEKEPPSRI